MNGRPIRTALFVDFDNVFLGLRDRDPALAEEFGRHPERWLSWLEGDTPSSPGGSARRLLLRRCYLNPVTFYTYRPHLVRAAVQVIDCPPLTGAGKNGADIQMVMDILDALSHPTEFDEFVILSGDSDFTPVLLRLRAYDRRTIILALGMTSLAYRAAADLVVSEEEFLDAVREDQPRLLVEPSASIGDMKPASAVPPETPTQWLEARERARDAIERWVQEAEEPLASAVVAGRLQSELGVGPTSLYAGSGTFKAFVTSLPAHAFAVDWTVPGWFHDPGRHIVPSVQHRQVEFGDAQIEAVARRLTDVTDIPLLGVEHYMLVFELLARDVSASGFNLADATRALRDGCGAHGVPVSRADADYIVKGVYYGGYQMPRDAPSEPVNADDLAVCFLRSAETSAAQAQVILLPDERAALERWLAPHPAA